MGVIDVKDVAARTKLATLNGRIWQTTRLHKDETRAENQRHNTNRAKVLVRISDHPALKELASLHAQARLEHKRLTMPTVQDGMRLIPVGRELEHSAAMRKFGDEHARLVRQFLADYPNEFANAQARLNGLFDPSQWPNPSTLPEKFAFSTRYLTTPTDGAWGEFLEESVRAAESEMREKVQRVLERVRDRCRAEAVASTSRKGKEYTREASLHASVFDAVRELADLVPDMDMSGEFAPIVQAMQPLTKLHSEFVRDDEDLRKAAAIKAESILSVLGGIQ
jgi:hypothetical protein